jgi:hypothetical protein
MWRPSNDFAVAPTRNRGAARSGNGSAYPRVVVARLLAVLGAGLVALVFALGTGTTAVGATGCAHPCDGGAQSIGQTGRPAPDPCIRDAGCGGGAAIHTGLAVPALVLVTGVVAALGAGTWRRLRAVSGELVERLFSGGLFRPPQVLFDA